MQNNANLSLAATVNAVIPGGSDAIAKPVSSPPMTPPADPGLWVDDHGNYLYSYAMVRLRDAAKAQDAVQETFLAALKNRRSFEGRSPERGWLVGILKHKIHDTFRKASRETSFSDLGFYEDEERERFVADGLRDGAWIHALGPTEWPAGAGESLDRDEFWRTFYACAAKLPRSVSRAFLLRELDGVEFRGICDLLNITENHLSVKPRNPRGKGTPGRRSPVFRAVVSSWRSVPGCRALVSKIARNPGGGAEGAARTTTPAAPTPSARERASARYVSRLRSPLSRMYAGVGIRKGVAANTPLWTRSGGGTAVCVVAIATASAWDLRCGVVMVDNRDRHAGRDLGLSGARGPSWI